MPAAEMTAAEPCRNPRTGFVILPSRIRSVIIQISYRRCSTLRPFGGGGDGAPDSAETNNLARCAEASRHCERLKCWSRMTISRQPPFNSSARFPVTGSLPGQTKRRSISPFARSAARAAHFSTAWWCASSRLRGRAPRGARRRSRDRSRREFAGNSVRYRGPPGARTCRVPPRGSPSGRRACETLLRCRLHR